MTDREAQPFVVNVTDVEPIVRHPEGEGKDWPLIHGRSGGTEHILFGYCVYAPDCGSQWHSHEEEDVFFIVSGRENMHYAKDDAEHVVPLLPGDAVFSGYLPNFVRNDGDAEGAVAES
jgi:mannose-6-phosphate isomerase-like protein (cupin superfamily)